MEYEESVDLVTERAMEVASEGAGHVPWHRGVAFTSLVLALLAATAALLAGITAHEVLIERTEEVIDVERFEGDRLSIEVLEAKHALLAVLGAAPPDDEVARIEAYRREVAELAADARGAEEAVVTSSSMHLRFAIAATVIAVAIAVSGLSLMMARRWVWMVGSLVGAAGSVILATALVDFLVS